MRSVLAIVLGQWQLKVSDGKEQWFEVERTSNAHVRCKAWGAESWGLEDWKRKAATEPVKFDDSGDVVLGERGRLYLDAFSEETLVWVEAAKPEIWHTWTRGWRLPTRSGNDCVDETEHDAADN